jgi:hypothetical protein
MIQVGTATPVSLLCADWPEPGIARRSERCAKDAQSACRSGATRAGNEELSVRRKQQGTKGTTEPANSEQFLLRGDIP